VAIVAALAVVLVLVLYVIVTRRVASRTKQSRPARRADERKAA
jgi:hypothetical protein